MRRMEFEMSLIANHMHTLSLLQRNIKLAPTKTKELLYKSLVRPQLEYASTVWSPWHAEYPYKQCRKNPTLSCTLCN